MAEIPVPPKSLAAAIDHINHYIDLLHKKLLKAQEAATKDFRHSSHRDYAAGIADGLQTAYNLLESEIENDTKRKAAKRKKKPKRKKYLNS